MTKLQTQTETPIGTIYRPAQLDEIFALRDVLYCRPRGLPAELEADQLALTQHFAAFRQDAPLACLTVWPTEWNNAPAWRVAALATHASHRRRGMAANLLAFATDVLRESFQRHWIWAEVPVEQQQLFLRTGFERASDEYLHPVVGPVIRLQRPL
jgi:predicted GNAT family N-acyltransferase